MRKLAKITMALGFLAAAGIGTTLPAEAYHHHHYRYYRYGYYGGGYPTWNGCPYNWTVQGGVCKPYRRGPWDWGYGYRSWGYRY